MVNKLLCLMLALSVTATKAQEVQKVIIGDNQNFGITYTLPQTAASFTVKAKVTKTKAGIYGPYAEKYLGIEDAAQEDRTVCEITSITLDDIAVPDSSRVYHILFTEKGALPTFYLNEDGNLLSINRQPDAEAEAKAPAKEAVAPQKKTLKASDVLNEDILKAGSKAKQAELTAREIFSIRESRSNLLKGDVDNMPADGQSFQLVLDNLDAQEQALLSLFVGTSVTTTEEKTYKVIVTENMKDKILFRFSRHFGFVDADDLSGEPYYFSANILDDNRNVPVLEAKKKSALGIAYTVPGKAHVKLSFQGETLAETDMLMGQLGHVEQLPVAQFTDKKKVTSASFSSKTGSIHIYE